MNTTCKVLSINAIPIACGWHSSMLRRAREAHGGIGAGALDTLLPRIATAAVAQDLARRQVRVHGVFLSRRIGEPLRTLIVEVDLNYNYKYLLCLQSTRRSAVVIRTQRRALCVGSSPALPNAHTLASECNV